MRLSERRGNIAAPVHRYVYGRLSPTNRLARELKRDANQIRYNEPSCLVYINGSEFGNNLQKRVMGLKKMVRAQQGNQYLIFSK